MAPLISGSSCPLPHLATPPPPFFAFWDATRPFPLPSSSGWICWNVSATLDPERDANCSSSATERKKMALTVTSANVHVLHVLLLCSAPAARRAGYSSSLASSSSPRARIVALMLLFSLGCSSCAAVKQVMALSFRPTRR